MSFRKYLIIVFLLIAEVISAQRSGYYIKNYGPKEYGGFNQMWQAVQDKNGLLYFAGTSSIYVFDGTTFQSVLVKSGSANRQIAIDSTTGIIYIGAVGEFGYLQRDSINGKLIYKSLTSSLTESQKVFSDVWKVVIEDGKIYFQSAERIFICEQKKIVGIIEAPRDKGFALMFNSNGKLIVRQRTVGLMELVNGKLQLIQGGERFANSRILGIIPWMSGQSLILSGDSGFFLMNKTTYPNTHSCFIPFSEKADTFLINHSVLGCKWVNDSTFAVYTRSGIGFFDQHAKLLEQINKSAGLADESIAEILVDYQKNIWLLHNYGISKVAYNSPTLFFNDESGYSGMTEVMFRFNTKLMVGTSEGLFEESTSYFSSKSSIHFRRLENIPHTEVWDLDLIKGGLFVSTSTGLFYMHDGKTDKISDAYVNRLSPSPNPDEFFTLEKGGMSVYIFIAGHDPKLIQHYELPGEEIIRVGAVTGTNETYSFWCANRFKDVIHVTFSVADTTIALHYYDTTNGIPLEQLYPLLINDTSFFFTSAKAYRYFPSLDKNSKSKCFFPAPEIFQKIYSGEINGLTPPLDFGLFLQSNDFPLTSFFGLDSKNKLFRTELPLLYCFDGEELQYSFLETNGIVWLASGTTILRYNTNIKPPSDVPFNAVISHVSIGKDSVIFFGSDKPDFTKPDAIPYKFNSVSFNFSAAYYEFDKQNDYFYKLEGFDSSWYLLRTTPFKSYTNLPEGTYTFRVKMISLLDRTSNEASYTFTILPPWYRSTLAYFLYFIGFIGSLFVSVRLGAKRLRKQKEKLEVLVTVRTAEVVKQSHKIEAQNFELEAAYKGIQDSIHYAERIQHAILPVQSEIYNSFPDSFVLFRPRDIVSGDFYWFVKRGDLTWIACVDCTGHGVPGAFMSMIGNTMLNEIVLEKNIDEPDKILNLLHLRIRQALRQDVGGETRDGMDISLCFIDDQKKKLFYAGANRALWMMRKNELQIFPPNKFSIGGDQGGEERIFTLHETELQEGDCIYLSSDGFADQFGGDRGKKFMVKRFQELLKEIHLLPMSEQHDRLEKSFLEWKGKLEQVDDVLVIGFRYTN